MNFALSSYPLGVKKSLVGCEREFLVRGGGDERFWVQVESLNGFVGGLQLPKVAVVFFSFCMGDAIFKYGARGHVIFDICWSRGDAVRGAVSWLCLELRCFWQPSWPWTAGFLVAVHVFPCLERVHGCQILS